jgi:hypothetical protein
MDKNPAPLTPVVPNRGIPKVLGILNIVFASAFLLLGLCQFGFSFMSPIIFKSLQTSMKKAEEDLKAKQRAEIQKLEEQEKAAKSEDEKAELRALKAQRAAAPTAPGIPMFDISMFLKDGRLIIFGWLDLSTGIVLNVVMLTAGIGLVSFRPWGRTLAVRLAVVKIVRLVLLYGYFGIFVVPSMSRMLGETVSATFAQSFVASGRPVPPMLNPPALTKLYLVCYSVTSVGTIVFGSIYPSVTIWLLNRPGAKAACAGLKSRTDRTDPW